MAQRSGYSKVVSILRDLPETKEFEKHFTSELKHARIEVIEFDVNWKNEITQTFQIQFGTNPERNDDWLSEKTAGDFFKFCSQPIKKFAEEILDSVWNTPRCRTFNCKRDKVEEKLICAISNENLVDSDRREELQKLVERCKESEDFLKAKRLFTERKSKNAIVDALKKFPDISDEVFQEALHEYLSERVVDS